MPSIPAEEATAIDAVQQATQRVLQAEQAAAKAQQDVVDGEAALKTARNTLRLLLGAVVLPMMLVAAVLCVASVGLADTPAWQPTQGEFLIQPQYAAYNAAVAESQRTGKPLLVLVCADQCTPCRALPPLYPQLRAKGAFVRIDAIVHRSLVIALRAAGSIPRLIIWHRIKGHWQYCVLVGADAIKVYAATKQ
jgi:thiol-disulfide isomerase/thioredoxin